MTTINQVQFPKVMIVGPSGFVADVNSSGELLTTGSGGGGGGTVSNVATSGIATGGPISTTGTINVTGSGSTTTAATAAVNLAAAPTGDVLTSDGSGNVQDSGVLLSTLALKQTQTVVGFSATPNFNASTSSNFKITLSGNVTSSTISGATAGQTIIIEIVEDSTGGRTFVWPTSFKNGMNLSAGAGQSIQANETNIQSFYYDGTNAYALTSGMTYP
jgi:hypothetical protein